MDTTVLIPAWNAEAYIERALRSIDMDLPVILVDDFSTDQTVERAQSLGLNNFRVIRPPEKRGLGLVRQTALGAVETPFAIWLDADDEYLPGRIARMLEPLRAGRAEITSDGQELFDGVTNHFIKDLPIPDFIRENRDRVRLFERNWLPGIAHVAFSTDVARRVNYDTTLHGGDDSDFVWRAILAGARFAFIPEKGYRMYAYPGSDSRKIEKQRAMVKQALLKHAYSEIEQLYRNAGFGERIVFWGLCSLALFRDDFKAAGLFLEQVHKSIEDPLEVLEPCGPYPVPEGWRHAFTKGVLCLHVRDFVDAEKLFRKALEIRCSPDVLNNLGVALRHLGEASEAQRYFKNALEEFPNYLDASRNLKDPNSVRITMHPLRMQASRDVY